MDDGDSAAKLAVQRESLHVFERAAQINPGNVTLRLYRSAVDQQMGDTLTAGGGVESARKAYLESATIADENVGSGNSTFVVLFITSTQRLALNAVAGGRRSDALELAHRALQCAQSAPPSALAASPMPRGLSTMGLTYAALLGSSLREPPIAARRCRGCKKRRRVACRGIATELPGTSATRDA
jgi:hypothetical protein